MTSFAAVLAAPHGRSLRDMAITIRGGLEAAFADDANGAV
jgi:hypothetical protein